MRSIGARPHPYTPVWFDPRFASHCWRETPRNKVFLIARVGADDEAWDNNGLMTTAGYPTAEIEGSQRLGVGGT